MLVRFSSTKTESIIMFGDSAVQLIKMLGATGNVPGALNANDLPAAIQRLQAALQSVPANKPEESAANDQDDNKEKEPAIDLAKRAAPLLDLLQRAQRAQTPVMWEAA